MTGQNIHRVSLKFWQRRIVVMGWVTYASYYLGRVNLSTAIPDLREGLHLSSQDVGNRLVSDSSRYTSSNLTAFHSRPKGEFMLFITIFMHWP